ncbi:WXG100 family type VII secretion target [Kitasatospora cineracea]|uniref:WXG100-like domain-containing protein n=1 Tax=Kitasatospora cineracea TaxID=88074 RepID=UPI0036DC1958
MAIELPREHVELLSFFDIGWPTVNEDKVREFAAHVREFAQNVEGSHQESTQTIQRPGQAYEGASYEALLAKWASASDEHFNELIQACHVVADALDIATDVIVGMKVEKIGELIPLAAAFVADQAAAVATFGAAGAAALLIEETVKRLVNHLEQQLEQYIIGQAVEAAIGPLIDTVASAVSGMAFQAAGSVLGVSGGGGGGPGFRIGPDGLEKHARMMHDHAETVAGHAQVFRSKIAGVGFE